jgi:hypothetical protein
MNIPETPYFNRQTFEDMPGGKACISIGIGGTRDACVELVVQLESKAASA